MHRRDLMTTTQQKSSAWGSSAAHTTEEKSDFKLRAWKLRQEDTGWARAVAHIVPIYPLIYGCNRGTVTPILYTFVGNFLLGVALAAATPQMNEDKRDSFGLLMALVATPVLAKFGISKSREYSRLKLIEKGINLPAAS